MAVGLVDTTWRAALIGLRAAVAEASEPTVHLLRGAARGFAGVMTIGQLEDLVAAQPELVDVARGGLAHPLAESVGSPLLDWLRGASASLRFRHADKHHDGVRLVATEFARQIAAPPEAININVYLSPGNTPGLAPHTDPYEVLVIQLEGVKEWRFGAHTESCSAGDLLFLPARHRHHVTNDAAVPSLHLAVGLVATSLGA